MSEWQDISTAPHDTIVETMIADKQGERNVQKLVLRQRTPETRPMWWLTDGSMYIYYQPTHWRMPQ